MAEPPSYAESMSEFQVFGAPPNIEKRGPLPKESHESQSLERQVELAMNRLVAPVVPQVVDYVHDRVLRGLSQTTVALIPSDQGAIPEHNLLVLPQDRPIIVRFEDPKDSTEFWLQAKIQRALRRELVEALKERVSVGLDDNSNDELAISPVPWAFSRHSLPRSILQRLDRWDLDQQTYFDPCRTLEDLSLIRGPRVQVVVDELHFRYETVYGLFETSRTKAIMVTIDTQDSKARDYCSPQ